MISGICASFRFAGDGIGINEESLFPSNALFRLVFVATEGYQRDGIDITTTT
jgi:hypothetical protein